jgi:hypothetical protein
MVDNAKYLQIKKNTDGGIVFTTESILRKKTKIAEKYEMINIVLHTAWPYFKQYLIPCKKYSVTEYTEYKEYSNILESAVQLLHIIENNTIAEDMTHATFIEFQQHMEELLTGVTLIVPQSICDIINIDDHYAFSKYLYGILYDDNLAHFIAKMCSEPKNYIETLPFVMYKIFTVLRGKYKHTNPTEVSSEKIQKSVCSPDIPNYVSIARLSNKLVAENTGTMKNSTRVSAITNVIIAVVIVIMVIVLLIYIVQVINSLLNTITSINTLTNNANATFLQLDKAIANNFGINAGYSLPPTYGV